MKKISIQFHALASECEAFAASWIEDFELYAAVVQYFPAFTAKANVSVNKLLSETDEIGDGSYRSIAFGKSVLNLNACSPTEFAQLNPNSLILHLGREDSCLREAWLTTQLGLEDSNASRTWNKVGRDLKSRTIAGAWAENQNTGGRSFYRNHRYTEGVRMAQKNGLVLRPSSGDIVRLDVISEGPK